jgi:hypothetical protein
MATTMRMILTALLPDEAGAAAAGVGTDIAIGAGAGAPHEAQDCAPEGSSVPHFEQKVATMLSFLGFLPG